ncbi:hypothetical protein BDZ89DRAFT_418984 [Hymenopellis radicata]|nr:hypothetical protein BDZ89DRAFT_418984 [Hymenopellis radicata]
MLRRHSKYVSLKEQEREAVQSGNALVVHAFEWLISVSSNSSVHRVVAQAVGGLLHPSSSIERLVESNTFEFAWEDMFLDSIGPSPYGPCIRPEKVDLLERLFRSTLHYRDVGNASFLWIASDSDLRTAIQSFPAPTLQWESAATAFLWHCVSFDDTAPAQKACTVVHRFMLDPRVKQTRLPAIVWKDLLAAASSCSSILVPDLSDPAPNLNNMITEELTSRVCQGWKPSDSDTYDSIHPITFEDALRASENFVWSLLSPFDKHKGNALDSNKVQRLLSLVNAIVSRGLPGVSRKIFFGTCKELTCHLQAGSLTHKDQEAICLAADTLFLKTRRTVFEDAFGPEVVLLPALLFLHCWKPHITTQNARSGILLALIKLDMFKALDEVEGIGRWCWRDYCFRTNIHTAPVASLVTSVICRSFESHMSPESYLEDSRWIDYLSSSDNSTAIVSMFTLQGTTDTPASVVQVRADLLRFFSSLSLDCDTLQKCRTSLAEDFVPPSDWDAYGPNIKEARKVIDELISKQSESSKLPANRFSRLLRRSKKSMADPEARD